MGTLDHCTVRGFSGARSGARLVLKEADARIVAELPVSLLARELHENSERGQPAGSPVAIQKQMNRLEPCVREPDLHEQRQRRVAVKALR